MHLSPGVHLAIVGLDLVILDARTDRYICVAGAGNLVQRRSRGLEIADGNLRGALELEGLIGLTGGAAPSVEGLAAPARELGMISGFQVRPRLAEAFSFFRAVIALRRFQSWSLTDLLTWAHRRSPRPSRRVEIEVLRRAFVFEALLPWSPVEGVCLYRSRLLLQYLGGLRCEVRWVFGVRTWPFEAHCWLQAGDIVLDDSVERIRAFTPIMVV